MMRPQILLAVTLTLVAVTSAAPFFCQGYDCPDFKADDKGSYEIREYQETKWVATTITSHKSSPCRKESKHMFRDLYDYIGGGNAKRERYEMTVPVLTKTERLPRGGYNITMMFYLNDDNPPSPGEKGVYLITKPAGNVFVRSFRSWRWPSRYYYDVELKEMERGIGNNSLYDDSVVYKAGYNSPYQIFKKKYHEIWMDVLE